MMVSARRLIGRRIVGFESRSFVDRNDSGTARGTAHKPRILLDDGTHLYFVVEELDCGDGYGVCIVKTPRRRRTGRSK